MKRRAVPFCTCTAKDAANVDARNTTRALQRAIELRDCSESDALQRINTLEALTHKPEGRDFLYLAWTPREIATNTIVDTLALIVTNRAEARDAAPRVHRVPPGVRVVRAHRAK